MVDSIPHLYNHIVMKRFGYETENPGLDVIFGPLADPTRRAILSRLASGEAAVKDLAEPFAMSQPAISKHLKVLEAAGQIDRAVDKQRRPAKLNARAMMEAIAWLEDFRRFWTGSFDQLDDLLEDLKNGDSHD